jgi:hypothetical protein
MAAVGNYREHVSPIWPITAQAAIVVTIFKEVKASMQGQGKFSRTKRLLLTSPYVLPVFLIIPAYTVLGLKLQLPVSGDLLLANNGCFLVFIAIRFVWYALGLRKDIRYGADCRPPRNELALDRPVLQLKQGLAEGGYRFDTAGHYGEKRDIGYLGTTLLYGGLLLLLLFGSYDYLREYSIMVRIGVGEPMSLDGKGLVGVFEAGDLAATSNLPLLQVKNQILPNAQWPQGATEIALVSKERKVLAKGTIAPGKPLRYGGLDFNMSRFIFDTMIVIRALNSTAPNAIVYEGFVKYFPLQVKQGEYSYFGGLANRTFTMVKGSAWLNPEKNTVRLDASLGGKKIVDTELALWGVNKKQQGEYLASLEGLAQWSEIRVARDRHRVMLMIGALLAVLGGLMRLVVRPQRVWLEEAGEGSRVRVSGGKTLRLLTMDAK